MTQKLTPTEQKIFDFIAKTPACTTKDIAAHFGKTEAWAGPNISVMFNQKKALGRTFNLEGKGYRWYVNGSAPAPLFPLTPASTPTVHTQTSEPVMVPEKTPAKRDDNLQDLVNLFVSTLADEVVARLRPAIVERLSAEVKSMTRDIADKSISEQIATPKLRKILVCGVKGAQGPDLQKEFDGVADIRFVGVDDNASLWKSRAAHADYVVLWTNFISHKHQESLTGIGVKPILVTGGVTAVKDKIMELCV